MNEGDAAVLVIQGSLCADRTCGTEPPRRQRTARGVAIERRHKLPNGVQLVTPSARMAPFLPGHSRDPATGKLFQAASFQICTGPSMENAWSTHARLPRPQGAADVGQPAHIAATEGHARDPTAQLGGSQLLRVSTWGGALLHAANVSASATDGSCGDDTQ